MNYLAPVLALIVLANLVQDNKAHRRKTYYRGSSTRSNGQCSYDSQCSTGKCVRQADFICGAGNFIQSIFGGRRRNQRVCHSYKCAQCTSNYHCSSGQSCSGYTCVNNYQPDYNNYNDYNNNNNYGFGSSKNNYGFGSSKNNYGFGSNNNNYGFASNDNYLSSSSITNYQDNFKFPDPPKYNDFSDTSNIPDWANF